MIKTIFFDFGNVIGHFDHWRSVHRLAKHTDMLTLFTDQEVRTNAVTVIISGNRPLELVAGETNRLAALDGRLSDLEKLPPRSVMPLISDNWPNHFTWRGAGEVPESEMTKLRALVARLHEQGRRVRFWGMPDVPVSWKLQYEAGVDLINTDTLAELAAWLVVR